MFLICNSLLFYFVVEKLFFVLCLLITLAFPWPLRRTGNWHRLAGVQNNTLAPTQLQTFWDRFRVLRPNHEIFELEKTTGLVLSRTVPLMIHGDEGRSKKRIPALCISAHSPLGFGVQTKKKRTFAEMEGEQQMNYSGGAHCARFLLSIRPKFYYDQNTKTFNSMMDFLARDIATLSNVGIPGPDNLQYYAAALYCKGDWPFLHKIAGLRRSFYNQPKRAQSKKDCGGICHWCCAGQPGIPFEDLSPECEWQFTLGIEKPWDETPVVLKHLTHDPGFPELFFHPDPWHCWHLGEGRNIVCNTIKLLMDITPGRNVDARLDFLFTEYKSFCSTNRMQCYCTKFSENLFGLEANDFPSGSWTKGNFTTSLVRWLSSYLHGLRNNFPAGSMLESLVSWPKI